MHICICSDGYPSKGLPYSSFIQVIAREFTRQGCEVSVIAPQSLTNHFFRGGKLAPVHFIDTFHVKGSSKSINVYRPYSITFGEGSLGRLTPIMNRLSTEYALRKYRISPDIFYSHFWANGFNARRIAQKKNIPLFVATGEDKINITNFIPTNEINSLKEYVTGVICVSTKNMWESVFCGLASDGKCFVIPNAYDPEDFYHIDKSEARRKLGFPEDSFIVAFCGRFNNRKGAMRVSEAIKMLHNPKIKSIFIGSVADNEKIEPDCQGILFKGSLPHSSIVHYLNCADVFVLPSLAEGCPNSVIEAMACGLPIISSDLPFNHDILNTETSILIDPTNTEEIASSINMLFENREMCNKLVQTSLDKSIDLTIQKRVARILRFIKTGIK